MARVAKKLTVRFVETVKAKGLYSDGDGLFLNVTGTGGKSWVFIYRNGTKRTELGLGRTAEVGLAQARDKALELRRMRAEGRDPLVERKREELAQRRKPTFGEFADQVVDSLESGWKNLKHREQWRMTLTRYAQPLRSKPIDEVKTDDIVEVLKPLWTKRPETASRLRGRIEKVLAAASASSLRDGPNPAVWRNHLDRLLPKRRKLTRGHHAAMDYRALPAFMTQLRAVGSVSALALEFTILTAARSGEVMGARWSEIDLEQALWTVPADRMKAGREHRVPLTAPALDILRGMSALRADFGKDEHVFPGARADRPLSYMALGMCLRRIAPGVTVHGFRSSFRDWAGEETSVAREVAEAALAHVVGDQTERAYRRGDALAKRRVLMDQWAQYLDGDAAGALHPSAIIRASASMADTR